MRIQELMKGFHLTRERNERWLLNIHSKITKLKTTLATLVQNIHNNYYLFSTSYVLDKCVLVAQSWPTLCNPVDCSPSGSSVHGILQARILEWVAIPFSRQSPWLRAQTLVSCIVVRFFNVWTTREAPYVRQSARQWWCYYI